MVAVSYTEFKAQVCGADSTKVNQREYLNNAFKSDFTCPECDKIVIDPQKCNKCETFFCLECAEKIKTGDLPCPVDSEKPFETSEISKFERTHLNQVRVDCSLCAQRFGYGDLDQHSRHCKRKVACPACEK
jgi:hypothetical protein